jgi:hypothetical protein
LKTGRRRFERSWDHCIDAWRKRWRTCTTRRRLEVRLLPRRLEGREPDGDGTVLIPREDVVRLHDALPIDNEE